MTAFPALTSLYLFRTLALATLSYDDAHNIVTTCTNLKKLALDCDFYGRAIRHIISSLAPTLEVSGNQRVSIRGVGPLALFWFCFCIIILGDTYFYLFILIHLNFPPVFFGSSLWCATEKRNNIFYSFSFEVVSPKILWPEPISKQVRERLSPYRNSLSKPKWIWISRFY